MKTTFYRIKIVSLVTAILLVAVSCKEEKKTEEPSRMEAVMAVHDSVMPRMSELSSLVAELKPLADSTEAGQPYREAMEDLQASHQAMMGWMRGFGERFDHEEVMKGKELSAQKKEWLVEEEQKVNAMRDQVFESIEKARAVLEAREGEMQED